MSRGHRHRRLHRPRSLFGRLMLIWFVGAGIVLGTALALYSGERTRTTRNQVFDQLATDIVTVVWLLDAQAPADRAGVLARLQAQRPRYVFALAPAPAGRPIGEDFAHPAWTRLARELAGRPLELRATFGERVRRPTLYLDTRLADGSPFHVAAAAPAVARPPSRILAAFAVLFAGLAIVTWIAVRIATRPLRRLADAAAALGEDLDRAPLAEVGPIETRQASRAFNRMQARIRELFDERTRILASITHDLQTPITRLQLRAELIADAALRDKTLADLAEMRSLVEEGLDYAKSMNPAAEPAVAVRLDALVASLVADYQDAGRAVSVAGNVAATIESRPKALRRLLSNLIDNALKFGTRATVATRAQDDAFVVTIADDGPGIPAAELEKVFEPFYRLESSRNRAGGGTGLGLAIARQLARSLGADLRLRNRDEGGLEATVRIRASRGSSRP